MGVDRIVRLCLADRNAGKAEPAAPQPSGERLTSARSGRRMIA
jgi:hypothetical protein